MSGSVQWEWRRAAITLAFLAVCASCALLGKDVLTPRAILSKAPGAQRIGSTSCLECHDGVPDEVADSVHSTVPLGGEPGRELCETCHGPGGKHAQSMDAADIFTREDLGKLDNAQRSGVCLSCHETMATRWSRSPHDDREISCWNCHPDALHGEVEVEGPSVDPPSMDDAMDGGRFCFQCHWEVEQEFLLQVRHPVVQGRMGCLACHGPHGEEGSLEARVDESELCTSCHVEVAGPWIYEHDAMFEGCTSCHAPHGSPNPKMLVMTGNVLCLQCHVEAAYPDVGGVGHGAYLGSGAACYQCHFEIHGSNTSEYLAPGM